MNYFTYKDIYNENGQRVLEVNILPEKACTFDCIFCPIGRGENKSENFLDFGEIQDSLKELDEKICNTKPDIVFINSKGEALLNKDILEVVKIIKSHNVKAKLLSNGYLLGKSPYMEIANMFDEVIGEMKVSSNEQFIKAQRPVEGYTLAEYIDNMAKFNSQYKGKFVFKITILKGYNDDEQSVQITKDMIAKIKPDEIVVEKNHDDRFEKKLGISEERLKEFKNVLMLN